MNESAVSRKRETGFLKVKPTERAKQEALVGNRQRGKEAQYRELPGGKEAHAVKPYRVK